jgi:hypothetical protein
MLAMLRLIKGLRALEDRVTADEETADYSAEPLPETYYEQYAYDRQLLCRQFGYADYAQFVASLPRNYVKNSPQKVTK